MIGRRADVISGSDGGHGVNLGSNSCSYAFGSFSLSLFLSFSLWTAAHGIYARCYGRVVSYMYTGCLVIKSPHGVVSLTSYTPSLAIAVGMGGRNVLSVPCRIAIVMTLRGPWRHYKDRFMASRRATGLHWISCRLCAAWEGILPVKPKCWCIKYHKRFVSF